MNTHPSLAKANVTPMPYIGLRSFGPDDADIFFGREDEVEALLAMLEQHRFLMIHGSSGCGKSSLARAGVVNDPHAGFISGCESWLIVDFRPGNVPSWNLCASLLRALCAMTNSKPPSFDDITKHQATLLRGPEPFWRIATEWGLPAHTRVLLLVDQFEELFRFRDINDPKSQRDTQEFVDMLLTLAHDQRARSFVLITMRTDFLTECYELRGLSAAINASQYLTSPLEAEQVKRAITEPAQLFDGTVESEVVEKLCQAVGTDPDGLPLLQHTLMRMWTLVSQQSDGAAPRLTMAMYEAVGGLRDALNVHAKQIFEALALEDQDMAKALFISLSERKEGIRPQYVRAPRSITDCTSVMGIAATRWQDIAKVADKFRAPDIAFLGPIERHTIG